MQAEAAVRQYLRSRDAASCLECAVDGYLLIPHVEAPGVVLRCSGCDSVLLVLVRRGTSYVLAVQGMTWLELSPG